MDDSSQNQTPQANSPKNNLENPNRISISSNESQNLVTEGEFKNAHKAARKLKKARRAQNQMPMAWKLAQLKKIKKTFILTIVLVLLGFALLIWGSITVLGRDKDYLTRGISILVIGVLLFLPGGYQAHHIYKALNKVPGYRFETFDAFEDT